MPNEDTRKARREAARKERIEAQRARERAKKRKRLMVGSLVTIVALLAGFLLFQRFQSTRGAVQKAAKQAKCSGVRQLAELNKGTDHLPAGAPDPKYNSNPPTSGPHLGSTAPWGAQDETVDKKLLVHNLEHGGVIIHYKDLPPKDVDAINDLVDSYPDGVIAQPSDDIERPVAISAWRHLQTCQKVSIDVIKAFIKEHCNKGPEKLGLGCG